MIGIFVFVTATLVLIIGAILLQIYLSKKESKYPGLVLPGLSFLYALVMSLCNTMVLPDSTAWEIAMSMLVPLFCLNIPTYIFLAIYSGCRENRKKAAKAQLDKMNIQDLD